MWKFFGNKRVLNRVVKNERRRVRKRVKLYLHTRGRILYAALLAVGVFLIAAASQDLISTQIEYASARSEYEQLRDMFTAAAIAPTPVVPAPDGTSSIDIDSETPPQPDDSESNDTGAETGLVQPPVSSSGFWMPVAAHLDLKEINPDYIGWIYINNQISYPVVRGRNNSHYIYTTFSGQRNSSGAIFMDHRNSRGFDEPVVIIYGHNMGDGSMFAPLNQYLGAEFMEAHPEIVITTPDEGVLTYRIIAVRQTDAWDRMFYLSFTDEEVAEWTFRNAPDGAERYLILSTCTHSADRDERLLIYAALVT